MIPAASSTPERFPMPDPQSSPSDQSPEPQPPAQPVGRVLQLLGPSAGGIRRHVASLVEGLGERGWSSRVAGPDGVLDGIGPQDHVVPITGALSPQAVLRARRASFPVARRPPTWTGAP